MNEAYPIGLEVSGTFGMFADPASGSEAISYPLPPPSACIGMIESICWVKGGEVTPIAVATCAKPRWVPYNYNSYSDQRKQALLKSNNALQLHNSALYQPCFQILAILTNNRHHAPEKFRAFNNAHSFQDQFFRRLRRGRSYHPVSLGHKQFIAEYVGPMRSQVFTNFATVLPSMWFSTVRHGRSHEDVRQNVEIEGGVLHFCPESEFKVTTESGRLAFVEPRLQKQIDVFSTKRRMSA